MYDYTANTPKKISKSYDNLQKDNKKQFVDVTPSKKPAVGRQQLVEKTLTCTTTQKKLVFKVS